MENIGLKEWVLKKILEDNFLKGLLCKAFDRGYRTVENMANDNDPRLTQKHVLILLSQYLSVSEEELLRSSSDTKVPTNSH